MRPKERRDSGQGDRLRSRLDAIIDKDHALVKLARTIDWSLLEQRFGAVYEDKPGRPPLPTRLMAGLAILKHTYDLSDEVLCERWVENPYYQFFCGEEFFQHRLVLDRSSLTRWRQRMGEERLQALLQESLSVAAKTKAIKLSDLNRVIVDTTFVHPVRLSASRGSLPFLRTCISVAAIGAEASGAADNCEYRPVSHVTPSRRAAPAARCPRRPSSDWRARCRQARLRPDLDSEHIRKD
jgi:hypothetical protein